MNDILTGLDEHILTIEFNRAEERNALTLEMYLEIARLLSDARDDPDVRVVLLHSVGDNFSAGNDLKDFLDHPPGSGDSPQRRLIDALRALDKPLVAAVRGAAVGSGATMLTYCDFVYAGDTAKLQYPFINLALVPEFGASFSLVDQVGYLRAAEIVLLGHPFSAQQALAMGLVTTVVADDDVFEAALKTARELVQKPANALRACKQLMRSYTDTPLDQAIQRELQEFSAKVRSDDAREAISAFVEKRPPRFNVGGPAETLPTSTASRISS
ncbi:enoyl-CoA hydratase (plasmid) [Rhizobium leguminosarum]|jgi:enoyl-CoA hydratase/carnithine racemase